MSESNRHDDEAAQDSAQVDPNTIDGGDEAAGETYRVKNGELTRSEGPGEQTVFSEGDEFEPTEAELRSFGDLLEPTGDDSGVGQPAAPADEPIPENAGADYVSDGERGERDTHDVADADDFEDATVAPEDADDQDADDLGELENEPVPEGTNVDYESRGETGDREPVEQSDAEDYPEREVDAEEAAGPAEHDQPKRERAETGDLPDAEDQDQDGDTASGVPDDYEEMNVGDVQDYLDSEDPDGDQLQAILDHEQENKNRTTVTDDLQERIDRSDN